MRSHLGAFAAGVLVATAVGAHALPRSGQRDRDRYASLDTFAQALSYITNNYVDDVDERALMYGAIRGMVERLDPHSAFLPPRRYQRLREDTEGAFGGVGLTLHAPRTGDDPPFPRVDSVIAGSPADRAGIRTGDRVAKIGSRSTAEAGAKPPSHKTWHFHLRGRAGTRIKLELVRDGQAAAIAAVLVREQIKIPTVDHHLLGPGVGYIRVSRFQEATGDDVLAALRAIRRQSDGSLRALILDLRSNPGGLLDQAVRVADLFLDAGTIVTVSGRGGSAVEEEVARAPGTWSGFPMIVLVDAGSASAAEIVAGALQDHGRATILGVATYGKGSVQTFMDLDDGSGLKLTTSRYYTPAGRSLHGAGIVPDIWVEAEAASTGGPHSATVGAGAPSSTNAKVNDRLRADTQLAIAFQTVLGWLGTEGP